MKGKTTMIENLRLFAIITGAALALLLGITLHGLLCPTAPTQTTVTERTPDPVTQEYLDKQCYLERIGDTGEIKCKK